MEGAMRGERSVARRLSRIVVALLACSLALPAGVASASPISAKRAQAVRIEAQVSALDAKAEIATEDYDRARISYDALHAKVVKAQASLASIDASTAVLQTSLDVRVDAMYRSGPLGFLEVLLGSASFDDFAATWDFLNEQNKQEAATVADLKVLHAAQTAAETDLKVAEAGAKQVYDTMSARRSDILAADAAAKSLLKGVQAEVAALQAGQRSQRTAAAKSAGGSGKGTGWNWGDPARAPRSGVVQIALKYLGRPYVWAASGPRSFDCSGFTMFVYAQVGVHLPHSSAMQINSGARVSRANLQPGDLLFFYSPIHHVAIYIGNGKMVHAPHSGDVVSIDDVYWQYFSGACRP
jgi:cell wall-associated NlpC family hydrolase